MSQFHVSSPDPPSSPSADELTHPIKEAGPPVTWIELVAILLLVMLAERQRDD